MSRILQLTGILFAAGVAVVTVVVERESRYALEHVSETGTPRALVLYHPSRDAHYSDDLSLGLAQGFAAAGFAVDRATLTAQTPSRPEGYAVIGVVSNTYFWTPDRPTTRYLRRARLQGIPAVGIMGGAGATGRSERMLGEAISAAGAQLLQTRSLWLLRPNDEARMNEPNRRVAVEQARQLGLDLGTRIRSQQ